MKKNSKKKRILIPYAKIPIEELGGAVVYARDKEDIYLAFVHDIYGYWTFPKGRIEKGESIEEGTIREIKEEIGIDIVIKDKLGNNEYIAKKPRKRKQVMYFLGEANFEKLTLGQSGGLDDAKWFKLSDIVTLKLYDDILHIVIKATKILLKK